MRTCKYCGAQIADNNRFCTVCGKRVEEVVPKRESNKNLPYIIGAIAIFGVAVLAVVIIGGLFLLKVNNTSETDVPSVLSDSVQVAPPDNPLYGLAKVAAELDEVESFHEGLAGIKKNGKIGVVNTKGEIIVNPMYEIAGRHDKYGRWFMVVYQEGLAAVKKNGKFGFIDKTGKEVVSCQYDYVGSFSEGLAIVSKNSQCGYIDKTGKEVIPLKYDNALDFNNGYAKVITNTELCGYINKKGEEVVPLIYELLGEQVNDGVLSAWKEGKGGLIDINGNELIPFIYNSVGEYSEGLVAVETDGKWGYVNKDGEMVIPAIYDNADKFIDGVAVVYKDGYYGIIDKKGSEVQPFIYDYYTKERREGLILIGKNDKIGIIDTKGKEVVPFEYAYGDVENSLDGYIMIKKGGKYGYQTKEGRLVIPCEYDKVGLLLDGVAAVLKDGVWGFVDIDGHSTFDIVSDDIQSLRSNSTEIKQDAAQNQFVGVYTYSYFYGDTNMKVYFRITLKQDGTFTHEPANDQTKGVVDMETVVDGKDYPSGGTWKVKDTSVGKAAFLDFDGSWGEGSITPDKSVIEIENMNGYKLKAPLHENK